jgi:hypothetical protein
MDRRGRHQQRYQDPAVRLHIFIAAAVQAACFIGRYNERVTFTITRVPRDGTSRAGERVDLLVYFRPGADADPVATVMMPNEA